MPEHHGSSQALQEPLAFEVISADEVRLISDGNRFVSQILDIFDPYIPDMCVSIYIYIYMILFLDDV